MLTLAILVVTLGLAGMLGWYCGERFADDVDRLSD